MNRLFRHLLSGRWKTAALFPAASLKRIEQAIAESEKRHSGEVRFAVEAHLEPWDVLRGKTGRHRALELFSHLRIWDTERNNGVLLYLLLADRDIEIIADRGINQAVSDGVWRQICSEIESLLRAGKFEEGVLRGISLITEQVAANFPPVASDVDELPNSVVVN